jgi:hypothetical protein
MEVTAIINDPTVRVSAGTGLSLSGTAKQTGDPLHITGTWTFTGLTQ